MDSGKCFGFWDIFFASGKCFGFWDVFLDSGKCFGFWDVFLDSGKCFIPASHGRSQTYFRSSVTCTRSKSVQKQIKSIDIDKVGSKKPLASKSCFV